MQLIAIGVVTPSDAAAAEAMCRAWALYRAAAKAAEDDPTSRDARMNFSAYYKDFMSVAALFGMTPVARGKIVVPSAPTDDDILNLYG